MLVCRPHESAKSREDTAALQPWAAFGTVNLYIDAAVVLLLCELPGQQWSKLNMSIHWCYMDNMLGDCYHCELSMILYQQWSKYSLSIFISIGIAAVASQNLEFTVCSDKGPWLPPKHLGLLKNHQSTSSFTLLLERIDNCHVNERLGRCCCCTMRNHVMQPPVSQHSTPNVAIPGAIKERYLERYPKAIQMDGGPATESKLGTLCTAALLGSSALSNLHSSLNIPHISSQVWLLPLVIKHSVNHHLRSTNNAWLTNDGWLTVFHQ